MRFAGIEILDKKPNLKGLPALHDENDKSESVEICLKDKVHDLRVYLLYTAFYDCDVISRSVRIENQTGGEGIIYLS